MLPLEEFTRLGRRDRIERAMARLRDVDLADAADKMPSEISGGMRKRAAIARAMALDPEVVFLDEPSAGLDPITSSALDDLILKLKAETGKTFVVVTHELRQGPAGYDRPRRSAGTSGAERRRFRQKILQQGGNACQMRTRPAISGLA